MLRRILAVPQFLFGLAIVILIVAALGWIGFTTLTKAPVIVAATVTGFAALFGVFVQRYLEHQREDDKQRRERMAEPYDEVVTTVYRAASEELAEDELTALFERFSQRLLLWGSPSVLRAFVRWRAKLADDLPESSPDLLFETESLIFALREDLGQSNEDLKRGDLLRVFINDIDDVLGEEDVAPDQ